MWHASAYAADEVTAWRLAEAALHGVGDAARGEFRALEHGAARLARRLTLAEEAQVPPPVDLRGTQEWARTVREVQGTVEAARAEATFERRSGGGEGVVTFWVDREDIGELSVATGYRAGIPAAALGGVVRPIVAGDMSAQQGDVAVFMQPRPQFADAIAAAKAAGLRVVLDIGDNPLAMTEAWFMAYRCPLDLPVEQVRDAYAAVEFMKHQQRSFMKRASAITTPTQVHADVFSDYNAATHVVPSAIDPALWPRPPARDDDVFRVGFSGTATHADDLPMIRDALAWAAAQDGVEVVFIGGHPHDDGFLLHTRARERFRQVLWNLRSLHESGASEAQIHAESERGSQQIEQLKARWDFPFVALPFANAFAEYTANLGLLDVAFVPLDKASSFRPMWRTDTKILECLMAGALPIGTDCGSLYPHAAWKGTIPLARDAADFVRLVQWACEHRDQVRAMAAAGRQRVLERHTIAQTVDLWAHALGLG